MEVVLRYVLTGTRGGPDRVRLLRAIEKHPRTLGQLTEDLGLRHATIRHHLDVLVENGFVENSGDDTIYVVTYRLKRHQNTVERLAERIE